MPRPKAVAKRLLPPATRTSQCREFESLRLHLVDTSSVDAVKSSTAGFISREPTLPQIDNQASVIPGPVNEVIEDMLERCVDRKHPGLCDMIKPVSKTPVSANRIITVDGNDENVPLIKGTMKQFSVPVLPFSGESANSKGHTPNQRKSARIAEKRAANQKWAKLDLEKIFPSEQTAAESTDVHTSRANVLINMDRCRLIKPVPHENTKNLSDGAMRTEDQYPTFTRMLCQSRSAAAQNNSSHERNQKVKKSAENLGTVKVLHGGADSQVNNSRYQPFTPQAAPKSMKHTTKHVASNESLTITDKNLSPVQDNHSNSTPLGNKPNPARLSMLSMHKKKTQPHSSMDLDPHSASTKDDRSGTAQRGGRKDPGEREDDDAQLSLMDAGVTLNPNSNHKARVEPSQSDGYKKAGGDFGSLIAVNFEKTPLCKNSIGDKTRASLEQTSEFKANQMEHGSIVSVAPSHRIIHKHDASSKAHGERAADVSPSFTDLKVSKRSPGVQRNMKITNEETSNLKSFKSRDKIFRLEYATKPMIKPSGTIKKPSEKFSDKQTSHIPSISSLDGEKCDIRSFGKTRLTMIEADAEKRLENSFELRKSERSVLNVPIFTNNLEVDKKECLNIRRRSIRRAAIRANQVLQTASTKSIKKNKSIKTINISTYPDRRPKKSSKQQNHSIDTEMTDDIDIEANLDDKSYFEDRRNEQPKLTVDDRVKNKINHVRKRRVKVIDDDSDSSSDINNEIDRTSCFVCDQLDHSSEMVLCDACSTGCHIYCMRPIRNAVPFGVWICPHCHLTAKKHSIHLSRMTNLRENGECLECEKRGIRSMKDASQICNECRLFFHTKCLLKYQKTNETALRISNWACKVCTDAKLEKERKEKERIHHTDHCDSRKRKHPRARPTMPSTAMRIKPNPNAILLRESIQCTASHPENEQTSRDEVAYSSEKRNTSDYGHMPHQVPKDKPEAQRKSSNGIIEDHMYPKSPSVNHGQSRPQQSSTLPTSWPTQSEARHAEVLLSLAASDRPVNNVDTNTGNKSAAPSGAIFSHQMVQSPECKNSMIWQPAASSPSVRYSNPDVNQYANNPTFSTAKKVYDNTQPMGSSPSPLVATGTVSGSQEIMHARIEQNTTHPRNMCNTTPRSIDNGIPPRSQAELRYELTPQKMTLVNEFTRRSFSNCSPPSALPPIEDHVPTQIRSPGEEVIHPGFPTKYSDSVRQVVTPTTQRLKPQINVIQKPLTAIEYVDACHNQMIPNEGQLGSQRIPITYGFQLGNTMRTLSTTPQKAVGSHLDQGRPSGTANDEFHLNSVLHETEYREKHPSRLEPTISASFGISHIEQGEAHQVSIRKIEGNAVNRNQISKTGVGLSSQMQGNIVTPEHVFNLDTTYGSKVIRSGSDGIEFLQPPSIDNIPEILTRTAVEKTCGRESTTGMGIEGKKRAVFVKSGCMRAWRLLNVMPEKPFHASMFVDMEQKSFLGDAVRIGISEKGEVRVVAFSKLKCKSDNINRLLQWWKENSAHFDDVTKIVAKDDVLTSLS